MSTVSTPAAQAHSIIAPGRWAKRLAAALVCLYALFAIVPMAWIIATSFKSTNDSIAYPPKVVFEPTLEGYVNVFTSRSRQSSEYMESLPPPQTWYEELVRDQNMVITGPSRFADRYMNSLVIGFGATFLSVFLGALAAYAFSRFRIPLKDDLMFFILSTRMFPPVAIAIPVYLMYRELGLNDSHAGMILLYTAVNLSLSVWLLKGFMDEIPREYEEAAMVDGYTRFQAFWKVVLPQARAGLAATAIFCLIFSWNEYNFAILLTSGKAQTAPPFIPQIIGEGGLDWPAVAAATTLFLLPAIVFTIFLRRHLLAGITFGAVRR
ncbi:MAG: carbohydrate ABC transporter permease [Dichotomicrobium sp.]